MMKKLIFSFGVVPALFAGVFGGTAFAGDHYVVHQQTIVRSGAQTTEVCTGQSSDSGQPAVVIIVRPAPVEKPIYVPVASRQPIYVEEVSRGSGFFRQAK